MKKRFLTLILATLTCFTCIFGVTGCDKNKQFTVTFVADREGAVLAERFDESVLVQTVSHYSELIIPVFVCESAYHYAWNKPINDINSDITLKATWKVNDFTVTFSSGVEDAVLVYGEEKFVTNSTMSIKFPKYTRPGYTQDETWGGVDLQTITIPSDQINPTINFVATWIPNTYYISFVDQDGKTELFDKMSVTFGSVLGVLPTPEKDNRVFAGWKIKDKSTILFADKIYRYTEDITLQATWAEEGYFPILYTNVEEVDNPLVYKAGDTIKLNNPRDRVGYDFIGWTYEGMDEPKKDVVVVVEKGTSGCLVFTANWKAKQFGVTLNHENGNTSQITVTYGEKVGKLPTPQKDGFKFVGWYTQNGTEITEGMPWLIDDTTVYLVAKYLRFYTIRYVLEYNLNGDLDDGNEVITRFSPIDEIAMIKFGYVKSETEENVWILSNVIEGTVIKKNHLYEPIPINEEEYKFYGWRYFDENDMEYAVSGGILINETNFPGTYDSGVITFVAYCWMNWTPIL